MKPDCQQVLTQFASFSVEELSDSEAASLLAHLEECEPCKGQWMLFEKSLTIVTQSGPRDEDVEQFRSQQMWLVCLEHARQNADKRPALAAHTQHHENHSAHSDSHSKDLHKSPAPRVNMTVVGGALLLLSYAMAAHAATAGVAAPAKAPIVAIKTTSYANAPLVDYGATLGFKAQTSVSLIAAPTKNLIEAPTFESR